MTISAGCKVQSVSFLSSALSQLAGRPSRLEGGPVSHPDLDDLPPKSAPLPPKGPWLTRFGPNLWMGVTSCRVCVCVFTCVFMETAVPFRYIVEVHAVQKVGAGRRGDWPGRPVGDLPLLGCQGQKPGVFNIAWEKSKVKRIGRKHRPTTSTSSPGGFGRRAWRETLASEVRVWTIR